MTASSSSFHSDKVLPSRSASSSTSGSDASPASTPVKCDGPKDSTAAVSPSPLPMPLIRNRILGLSALVGQLSSLVLQHFPVDQTPFHVEGTAGSSDAAPASASDAAAAITDAYQLEASPLVQRTVSQIWSTLWATAALLSLHLPTCILQKMELNRLKYPVHLVRGKAGKYTEYSGTTGITKYEGQSTLRRSVDLEAIAGHDVASTLTGIIREFAEERQWSVYHLPRNLLLALLGELGELAELVQWNGDADQSLTVEQLDKLSQELADVAIYLLRFANVIGITVDECAVE